MELQTRTSSERHIITRDKDFQACSNMMFRGRPEDVVGEGGVHRKSWSMNLSWVDSL